MSPPDPASGGDPGGRGPPEAEALQAENAALRQALQDALARLAEAEALADRDALTPVLNRRAFMRELERAIDYSARYGGGGALVFLDMDGFKGVNDAFGHAAGDAALRCVAAILVANVRGSDLVGRLGGDEFAVYLARADVTAATAKARSLAALIAAEPFAHAGRPIALNASIGIRPAQPGATAAQLVAEADAAMFVDKGAAAR